MTLLEWEVIVKFIKSLCLSWHGLVEKVKTRVPEKLQQLQWKEQRREENHVNL
jgi:hypothetical protein